MPGRLGNTQKRTHNRVTLSDEEDDSGSDTSSKRPRLNSDASVHVRNYLDIPTALSAANRPQNGRRDDEEYDEDTHQPGSIVRVKLTNFVTYTAAEFHPGPSLNMVIGPNGTGKSTLVCAICLGLGWSPKHLGRAKDIGEFVKHGSDRAEIEIELAAGKNHRKNPVIRRSIRKEGNKSQFWINGQQTTQNAVTDLARSFSIQIDNLCQFLPQDRVVEFARLDPVSLLRETQRAAAPEQMTIWHDELKKLRATEKSLEIKEKNEDGHLAELQRKQTATQEDVNHWTQRQDLILEQKALEICRPIIAKSVLYNQVQATKADLRNAKRELQQLKAEEAPARQAQDDAIEYRDQIKQVFENRTRHVERAKKSATKIVEDIKNVQSAVKESMDERDAERDAGRQRKTQVQLIEKEILKLEQQREIEPPRQDEGSNARINELRSKVSEIERRVLEVNEKQQAAKPRANDLKQSIADQKREREKLNTQSGQQASLLQKLSGDAARGWKWIEEHRATLPLKGRVYGPPILECSVTDPRYADAVESQLRAMDFTAITCEDVEDTKLISNKLLGELKLHQVSIRTSPKPLSFYQSPVTKEELTSYGFEGWLKDYLSGPEAVLAMLCDSSQIHRVAFSSRQISDQQHHALESSPISSWVAGQEKCQITRRREYNVTSTRVNAIRKAQLLIDQPVDTEQQRRLDNAIKETEQDLQETVNEFQALRQEMQELKDKQQRLKAEMVRLS
jgi:chromosome segregation ATPase